MKRAPLTIPTATACLALALAGSASCLTTASAQDQPGQDSAPQIGTLAGAGAIPTGWYFLPLGGREDGPYSTSFPARLRAIVHVPPGYTTPDGRLVTRGDVGSRRTAELWVTADISRVDTEPCGGGMLVDPGPTVEDLADALAVHAATPPRSVTVDGYDGLYLEVDTADDVAQCPGGIYRLMDDRAERTPGTSHLWILAVEGFRVVATVKTPQGVTADSEQTVDMAQNLVLVPTRAPH